MGQKKRIGYGTRGWVLIIWIATAFLAYTAIGNYPLNILSDLYGGQQTLSSIYTVASIIGVIVQLIASSFIGRLKSVKRMGVIFGILSILALLASCSSRDIFRDQCRCYGVLFTDLEPCFPLCTEPSRCPSLSDSGSQLKGKRYGYRNICVPNR